MTGVDPGAPEDRSRSGGDGQGSGAADSATHEPPRRPRDRSQTEAGLLDAAWAVLRRDGVLGGVNLQEVADQAQVNRALIYRYFGSREALLAATLRRRNEATATEFEHGRRLPFVDRRVHAWDQVIQDVTYAQVLALLALQGDAEFQVMPFLERTRASLDHDRETGALPDDVDGPVAHALSVAAYLGYSVFRDVLARELELDPEELDRRATELFEKMMRGIAGPAQE